MKNSALLDILIPVIRAGCTDSDFRSCFSADNQEEQLTTAANEAEELRGDRLKQQCIAERFPN